MGQASNRALRRCKGEIIGSLDADNLLEPDGLACAVEILARHPNCAALYGASKMIDAEGRFLGVFQPAAFELTRLLRCELVPPFASSFFSRRVCGPELRFDETLETCPDYDLWLRIGHLPIVHTSFALASTRVSENSMTRRPERYQQFCRDKIATLERYFTRYERNPVTEQIFREAVAGIYAWAAESIFELEGSSHRFHQFFQRAVGLHASSERLQRLGGRVETIRNEVQELRRSLKATQAQLQALQQSNVELRAMVEKLQGELQAALTQVHALQQSNVELRAMVEKLQDDLDWSIRELTTYEHQLATVREEKKEMEDRWQAVEASAGWRLLNRWRRVRDRLAPDSSWRRRLYDSLLDTFRGNP